MYVFHHVALPYQPLIMLSIKHVNCVSNAMIYVSTDTQPLINLVRQRQLHFLGRV